MLAPTSIPYRLDPMPALPAILGRLRRRGMAGDSAWGMALEIASILGTIVAFTLLGRTLGAEGYGGYASLYAIFGPLVTFAASGVTLALLQHVVRDREGLEVTARSCLSQAIVIGAMLSAVGGVVAFWVIDTLSAVAILALLLVEFVMSPLVNVAAATVQAASGFAGAARIRLGLVVGRMVVLVALFAAGSLTVESFGVSQLIWSAVLAVISLRSVGRQFGFAFRPGRMHRRHLTTNALYSVAISADAVGNDGDKVVLAASGYRVETGLYAAAYRIIGLGLVPIGTIVNVSHKRFLESERGRRREHLDLALRFSSVSGAYGIAFGLCVFLAAPLFPMLMGDSFEGSVTMMRWLAPIVFLRAIGIFSLNALMGLGQVHLRTAIVFVNAAFGVVLFLVLIPSGGWEGAVTASLITEVMQVLLTWGALIVCQRRADQAMDAAPANASPSVARTEQGG